MRRLSHEPAPKASWGTRPNGRLYGREADTAALTSALDAVTADRARLLSLEGTAGTGKSALLARAAADAQRRGWTVLTGRGARLEATNDFGVLREVLSGLSRPGDGQPIIECGLALRDASPFEVFEKVFSHLVEATAGAPILIGVDDLQWCDALSLRWLAYLAHRSADLPVALVLSGSPEETAEHRFLVEELITSCERRTLRQLTRAQVSGWIADVMDRRPNATFVEGCHQTTAGNGALLADLLPALAARSIPAVEESLALIERVGIEAVSRRVLGWIRRGGPDASAVAEAVAVLGDDGELVLVAELAGLDLETTARAADRLIKLGILSDTSPLSCVHPLTRAVVNERMSAGLRTSRRLRAARLIHDHYAEPERAATHLIASEMSGEGWVLDTLRAAAVSALDTGRVEQALGYLRRALAAPMPTDARVALLTEIGAIEIGAGMADADRTLHEALAIATEPSLRVRIGVELACADATVGRPLEAALHAVDQASAQLPRERVELAAEAEFGVFMVYALSCDAGEFVDRRLPRLRKLTAGDTHLTALAGLVEAWADARRGKDRAECVRRARSALAAVDHQKPWQMGMRWPALSTLIDAEEYDLIQDPGELGGFADRQGPAGDASISAYLRGRLAYGRGDLRSSREQLGAMLENRSLTSATGAARLARVLTDIGDIEAADRLIHQHAPTAGETWAAAAFAFAKASASVTRDQTSEALEGFMAAGRILRGLGIDNPAALPWRSQAARCHAVLGDADAAASLAAEEVALARRWGARRTLSTALATSGIVGRDRDTAVEAVAVLDGLDAQLHRAAALVDLGTVLLETGKTVQAQEPLQEGYAQARMIGARPLWLKASRYLKRVGGRPDLRRISGVTALTAQERATAERAAAGATNRQIADQMVLTQRTVEQYLTSTYRKLGITGRPQLAAALSA